MSSQPNRDAQRTGVALIGSTGSIGTQTLDVLERLGDRFRLVSIAARNNVGLLAEQIDRFGPDLAVHSTPESTMPRQRPGTRYATGASALIEAVTHPEVGLVVIASSGHAALEPAHAAILAGKDIALANKEIIVCGGQVIMPLVRKHGISLRPIDSEHSAIWQCLGNASSRIVARIVLTASGGPFRSTPLDQLQLVTVADALRHPTWSMGAKITIDSATMANKGLELIEACWLFNVEPSQVDAMIHPQSIVHSLVEFIDGSQLAQLSWPDMRLPIQLALTYPDRVAGAQKPLSLADVGKLEFASLEAERYPAFALAREAISAGDSYPTAYSVADELAVSAFLEERIAFTDIARIIDITLERHRTVDVTTLEGVSAAVAQETRVAQEIVRTLATARGR